MKVTLDPSVHVTLRAALALLFAWAAVHKLRDVDFFKQALANYELLPTGMTMTAVVLVIVAEVSIAFALALSRASGPALAAAALLAVYTVAISVNIRRGRGEIDCGCAGPAHHRPLSNALIGRNLLLVAVALIASLSPSSRALVWIDAFTIIGAVAFLAVLYGAIETVTFNASHLAVLRGAAGGQAHEAALGGEAE